MAYSDDTVIKHIHQEDMDRGFAWLLVDHPERSLALQGVLYLRPRLPSEGMHAFAELVSRYTNSRFNISVSPDSVDRTHSVHCLTQSCCTRMRQPR